MHNHEWTEDESYPQGPLVVAALAKPGKIAGHRTCGCGAAQTLVVKRDSHGGETSAWRPDEMLHHYL